MNVTTQSPLRTFGTYAALTLAVAFATVPIIWAIVTSLKPESQVLSRVPEWIPQTVTLDNYAQVFESQIPVNIANSIGVGFASVMATLLIAIPAAYASARYDFKSKKTIVFFLLATSFIPAIAILIPMYFLVVRLGIFDTRFALALVYTAWQVPTATWLLRGFFEAVPREIEEAGRVDGCTHIGAAFRLVLPIARPGIAATAAVVFVYIWNDYLIAATMVSDESLRMVSVGLFTYLSQYGIVWGQLTAAMVMTLVPVIILFALLERRLIHGLSAGAVKE